MKHIFRILLVTIFAAAATTATAQYSITGKITDKNNGESLAGAYVVIEKYNVGTATNNKGEYILTDIPAGEVILKFSYVGFQTTYKKVFISDKDVTLNIKLDTQVIEGQEVVISGNFSSTQHDNTIKISTLSSKEISESIAPSLVQSIAEVPGVDFISKGPGIGTPVIRGLSLSNILFLNNGVPLYNYQFSENHPYMVDENGIERVEIIVGPASLIYGSGAIGGVINLIGEPIAKDGTIEGKVGLSYLSNTAGIKSDIGLKGREKSFFWEINGGLISNKDYTQGDGKFAPNTRFNRNSLKSKIGFLTKFGSFKLNYQYNKDNLGLAVKPAMDLVTNNNRENKVWYQNLENHLLIFQNRLFFGKLVLATDLSYQHNHRRLIGSSLTPVNTLVDMSLQTFSYRVKSTYVFDEDLKVIFGIQGMFQNNTNADAPEHVIPNANIWDLSAYGLVQYNLGKKIILESGLRYSYKDINVPLQKASGADKKQNSINPDEVEYSGNFSNISASVGSTIKISPKILLRINVASAFRTPNIAELTQNGVHGTRYEMGNTNLVTQKNTEGDIGLHVHTKHASVNLSGFYNNVNNYIFLSPTTDTTSEGYKIYKYEQTASVLYGGEASIHVHPHPLHWLHIKSSYEYVVGKEKSGGYLPFIPAQRLKFEVKTIKKSFNLFTDIYLLAGIQFVLAQNQPSQFEQSTPGYNLVNIGFGTNINIKNQVLKFNINISNLLDTEYTDHLSTLQDVNIMDMGRSINLRLSIPFGIKN